MPDVEQPEGTSGAGEGLSPPEARHTPALHVPPVHALPSWRGIIEHVPVEGPQTPAVWHSSSATQLLAAPRQTPARQLSAVVQGSPSSQDMPSALGGPSTHWPVAESHRPAWLQAPAEGHLVAVP